MAPSLVDKQTRCRLPLPVCEPILALGADTASRPALAIQDHCTLAPACGDLFAEANYKRFEETLNHLAGQCDEPPKQWAHDLHPNYISTAHARKRTGITCHAVQHHEAHIASALSYFSLVGEVIGVAFDGTGYGTDGAVWGGEVMVGSAAGFRRVAHLQYVPMPGGEAAVLSPWKMAVSYVMAAYGTRFAKVDVPHFVYISEGEIREIASLRDARALSPMTSSVGRLFDAVAVLCGLLADSGQSLPAKLEATADPTVLDSYESILEIADDGLFIRADQIIRSVVEDMRNNRPVSQVAARFHNTLAKGTADTCELVAEETGIRTVVLSGGVFYNQLLLTRLTNALAQRGLAVYVMPPPLTGDEGIALGQAAIVAERIR